VSTDHGVWRHRLDLQFRRSQRQQDRDGVIHTGVRVDNYVVADDAPAFASDAPDSLAAGVRFTRAVDCQGNGVLFQT
jgi:hypothetical protein